MQRSGSLGLSSQKTRSGLSNPLLPSVCARPSTIFHHCFTFSMIFSCHFRSVFRLQAGQQCSECLAGVSLQVHVHRISQAQQPAVNVDLNSLRLPGFGIKLGIGKTAPDDQQRVAFLHQIPARFAAEQADMAGAKRHVFRHHRLAQPTLGDAGAEKYPPSASPPPVRSARPVRRAWRFCSRHSESAPPR